MGCSQRHPARVSRDLPSETAQRGSTKIPNSQKETVSTYLITCLGMPDRGKQSFCRVLLGLLRRPVLMPLLLCLILLWLWAISPALSGLFIRARQCCCETVGARVEKKQGGNNVRSLHFSPFPSLGKSRWISLGSQLKLTSGLLMAKTQHSLTLTCHSVCLTGPLEAVLHCVWMIDVCRDAFPVPRRHSFYNSQKKDFYS